MKSHIEIITALANALNDYMEDKETATQMENAIDDAIRFIAYHFAGEESEDKV